MADYVQSVEATGVYGRFDLRQTFEEGVNILYGKNGEGKTTFLHVLSNILNSDYNRFAYIAFKSIEVKLNDGTVILLDRESYDNENKITVRLNKSVVHEFLEKDVRNVPRPSSPRFHRQDEEIQKEKSFEPILPAAYFPAFRTM